MTAYLAEAPASPRVLDALLAEADAELDAGNTGHALAAVERARILTEGPSFGDADRAAVFFRLGRCRLAVGSVANAASLLTLALDLCDRSVLAPDALRVEILDWRARCYQRQRDWEAARADVERAVELAQALGDPLRTARVLFQASIVAERERQWLVARYYAEQARDLLTETGDLAALGKVLNNLGGIHFLLGDGVRATECLEDALAIAREGESRLDIGYALSSLAQLRLRTGDAAGAIVDAHDALDHLDGRVDHANEVASANLVLARAFAALARVPEADAAFRRAEDALRDFGSDSHLAAAWLVGGDVARAAGDETRAADLYRRAAEALQDVHF
ncbi:MAG: tetratricopeptide repeat protein [Actinobacteria bacterium]|nr:tetratricopeptide repeat protein [Actinomycetota bacterium]